MAYLTINFNLLQLTTFWLIYYVTVNVQLVLFRLKLGTETSLPLVSSIINSVQFHSSARINQTLPQIIHILHLSVRFVANYAPDFAVTLVEVMDVTQEQIWRDECTVGGFTLTLRMASLQTLLTKITVYDMHYRGYVACCAVGLWPALAECWLQLSCTFFSVCVCALSTAMSFGASQRTQ